MTASPDWTRPPREEGWFAEDLDRLHGAPRHIELIDGALVHMMAPQRFWHGYVIDMLVSAFRAQAPHGIHVARELTVRLDLHNRPEPDIIVTRSPFARGQTWAEPADVLLAVEVVSPESAERDRTIKPRKYAQAGIAHFWRVEEDDRTVTVHVHELEGSGKRYREVGVFDDELVLSAPFDIKLRLTELT
ncbi:Uma2 family endonuclease [Saccharothrix longispora]|uniref:Uma2 family endonuclease n=1 Tax=Saccharothrix longispora TaxID=33920 RepID=A0ABU1Q5J3_9PSEU|nr:Uma2 family endonuclease [Saccharothrix longispora]MDR6598160.1 Uma2 family endonuclease [Saccharothrix longispora]